MRLKEVTEMAKGKKSISALLRKSIAKSSGCCGAGETCGGSTEGKEKKTAKDTN